MRRRIAALALIAAAAGAAAAGDGPIVEVASGAALSRAALEARLRGADVVILGEVHDNPDHHRLQAELVTRLAPAALSFEMLGPGDEGPLARLRRDGADAAAIGAALRWAERGWPDFALYAPILAAAPAVPVTGGAVAPEALREAMATGAEAAARPVLGAMAGAYGLGARFDAATQAEAVAEQIRAHCNAVPESVAAGMVEAQRLRDAAFADAVLRARAEGGGGLVVLIAGAGHARTDRGVPAHLEAAAPGLSVVALAFVERAGDAQATAGLPFDYVWLTDPAPREDPCAAFLRSRR
jgi:uncharacterized iron-regulated protein